MARQAKQRIIAAAFHLFLKKGYNGVSLKDIISATELSKGAIYHHFASKYEIYFAAVEEYFFKLLKMDFPDDANDHIKIRLRRRFEYFVSQIDYVENSGVEGIPFPSRALFLFQLESEQDALILEQVQKEMEQYRAEITRLIQKAIDKNEISTYLPAHVIAQQLMVMTEGIAVHYSAKEKNVKTFLMAKYDEVIDKYLDLIVTKGTPESESSSTRTENIRI
ncbi:MAG: TetR/AcrR family transcriptional regulator [Bacteroidota bacterium]